MTQTAVQRKLVRTAASFNSKARRLGRRGRVSAENLAQIYLDADGQCYYCGTELTALNATYDHARSFELGGENEVANIRLSCVTDQRRKFVMSEQQYVQYRALTVQCACGKTFKPRAADYRRGLGRFCSRECSGRAGGQVTRT